MPRILVVDDDREIGNLLQDYLSRQGFDVAVALNAASARTELARSRPDLVVLDLMLGDEDGLTLGREIERANIPFVIVSARQDPVDRVVGLELGADDFVTKPFDVRELLARIRAVLRRAAPSSSPEDLANSEVLHFEGWRLDTGAYLLYDPGGAAVDLTTSEFLLLQAFARQPGRVLTRERISREILYRDWAAGDRSVDMLVSKLRAKIEPEPDRPTFIKTRRGLGYVFATRVTVAP